MFDFDVVEADDPCLGRDAERCDPGEAARRWAEDLGDSEWKVRWEACRGLVKLGPAAVPHLPELLALAETEKDGDVREEARKAFAEVRQAAGEEDLRQLVAEAARGLASTSFKTRRNACFLLGTLADLAVAHMPAVEQLKHEDDLMVRRAARNAYRELSMAKARAGPAEEGDDAELGLSFVGQTALFKVGKEVFPMRLDHSGMTPSEITRVWEQQWGVQSASSIKLEAEEGSTTRPLDPEADAVPRSPFVVKLEAPGDGVLQTMAYALREYGMKTAEEVALLRARKEQMLELAVKPDEVRFVARFRVLGEVLTMRLTSEAMTPAEVAEVWEQQWGVQYASKLRFYVPEDWEVDMKWFHPRNDVIPLAPHIVKLETTTHKSRSVLYSLQACMKQYGKMTPEEVDFAKANRY